MHLHQLQQARPASRELALFEDSILALYLGQFAARIFGLGAVCHLCEGDSFTLGGPQTLNIVLDGVLVSEQGWQGPGCHVPGDSRAMPSRATGRWSGCWTAAGTHGRALPVALCMSHSTMR